MNEKKAIRLYVEKDLTLREVAKALGTDHHQVKRILQRHGVPVVRKSRSYVFTEEHRRRISERCKGRTTWAKGAKMSEAMCRKNMKAKLKTAINLDKYEDFQKLKLLTKLLAKRKPHLASTDQQREAFLDRFYFDEAFSAVYQAWVKSGKSKWYYPSLDHICPRCGGGGFGLENLRFITWFENRAKADMDLPEWLEFREKTGTESKLFIEAIVSEHRQRKGTEERRADRG